MTHKPATLIVAVLALAACAPASSARSASPAAPGVASSASGLASGPRSPAGPALNPPAGGPLLVVLDGIPTSGLGVVPGGITLVTPTGRTVAHVPIQTPKPPVIANCGNLLPPPVYIAAGGVYWSDEKGVIRRLETDGRTSTVASFDLHSGQQVRFAVSPDGGRIIASMLTVPPITGGLLSTTEESDRTRSVLSPVNLTLGRGSLATGGLGPAAAGR